MAMTFELPLPRLLPRPSVSFTAHTDERLYDACGVRVAFTGRGGGSSAAPFDSLNLSAAVGDNPEAVRRNRALVLEAFGAEGFCCVFPRQVHGDTVLVVAGHDALSAPAAPSTGVADYEAQSVPAALSTAEADYDAESAPADPSPAPEVTSFVPPAPSPAPEAATVPLALFLNPEADAIVAEEPGIAALLSFADCVPVVAVSPTGRFAVIHAGWRGVELEIAGKAIRRLAAIDREAGASGDVAAYNVYIGAHIQACCFEAAPDLVERFDAVFGPRQVTTQTHIDLNAAVRATLGKAGIVSERIADVSCCTACNTDSYFSHRASGGTCGRQGAFAFRHPSASNASNELSTAQPSSAPHEPSTAQPSRAPREPSAPTLPISAFPTRTPTAQPSSAPHEER